MRLNWSFLDEIIIFEENFFNSIIIENQNVFRGFLENLVQQVEYNIQTDVPT